MARIRRLCTLLVTCVGACVVNPHRAPPQSWAPLRDTLVRLRAEDQAGRDSLATALAHNDTIFIKRFVRADSARARWLQAVVAKRGWPRRSIVGDTAAETALLIVQHSPIEAFQEQMLPLLEDAAKHGEANAGNVAMLFDRVHVRTNRAQRYGTQFSVKGGKLVPDSIADLTALDSLRASVGLPPMTDYVKLLAEMYRMPVEWPPTNVAIAQSHTLVSVGDHRLDVVREGTGGPAVIFETGLADSLNVWLPMVHTVAAYTTAVAYSRAGFGRSDPGPSDHSVPHAVTDLHELLHRLQIKPPYVLVARSYGSLISRLYVSLYPKEVAGIVLVDGTHEQQVQRFGALDSTYPRKFRQYFDSVVRSLPPGPEAAEITETVKIQAAGTVPGLKPLPDIPIAVLTSMKSDESAPYVNGTARGHVVWRELHDEWFRRSRDGIHIQTTHSGHDIQDDEPGLVAYAIKFVVDRVRAAPAQSGGSARVEH